MDYLQLVSDLCDNHLFTVMFRLLTWLIWDTHQKRTVCLWYV